MVGMWRFLQDKGTILDEDFRLSDADNVIQWNLERVSTLKPYPPAQGEFAAMRSTYGTELYVQKGFSPALLANDPLKLAADPFATLFLYQLFEALVRLAHHRLRETFPDSLILQVTRFLENSILMPEDEPPKNEYSIFRKSISNATFDDVVTKYSPILIQLYLEFSGYAAGCSLHQIRQLEAGIQIDPHVEIAAEEFQGIMTVRDFVLFLGDRGFFGVRRRLQVSDVLLFQRFESVTRELQEGEADRFRKFFTSFTKCRVTFVEFVQTLAFVGARLVRFDWSLEKKFEYLMDHIDGWKPPVAAPGDVVVDEEEEKHEPPPPPPPEKPEKHSRKGRS
jgi:hypothetical protein